jgi:hypothetical protein
MMGDSGRRTHRLVLRLFEYLLHLFPPRFRREFAAEIRAVFLSRMRDVEEGGGAAWLAASFREITGLVLSILREGWHELMVRKRKTMVPEDQLQKDAGAGGAPGVLWLTGWTLLMTAAIPAAMIAMAPLAVIFLWLMNLGVKAGFWPATQGSTHELLGALIGFALVLASVQSYLLRRFLPRAWLWFIATVAGVLLAALAVGLTLGRSSVQSWDPIWIMAAVLLPLGLALGLAHWLFIRRFLPNAFWIIFIDVLAFGSILLSGGDFTSPLELMVLVLPGGITGLGLLLLLSQSRPKPGYPRPREASRVKDLRLPRRARVTMGGVALLLTFFGCIWAYAASQLALAKNEGIYPTVEKAVIARNSQGFGGAQVVRIEEVWAEPNSRTAQPHVWFGGATVYMDRVPEGYNWDHYNAGSFYIHIREGWVHVPEEAFPEFIGLVMQLYNMEGVD